MILKKAYEKCSVKFNLTVFSLWLQRAEDNVEVWKPIQLVSLKVRLKKSV